MIARADTSVDLTGDAATSVVLEPEAIGSDQLVVTEEWEYRDGIARRRSPDGAWAASGDCIAATALGFEVSDDRLEDAIVTFVRDAKRPLTAVGTDDGAVTYTSETSIDGASRSYTIDPDGRLIALSITSPPAGVDADDPRRGTFTVEFDGFDSTPVHLSVALSRGDPAKPFA
jgi:hypothetical protein